VNILWLYITDCILLARVPLLFRDRPVKIQDMALASAAQLIGLLALEPSLNFALLAAGIVLINLAWWYAERSFPQHYNAVRLGILACAFILVSFFCSPYFGLSFRASLASILARVSNIFVAAEPLLHFKWNAFLSCAFGLLLCLNETNLVVRLVIDRLELRPRVNKPSNSRDLSLQIEYRRGRVVGLLERLILFFLVLAGQYTAVGFVIAAKTMARFKDFDDRGFAEYFLIGTLLSCVSAGTVALITQWLWKL
jgi:hypothetical protein